MAAKNKSLSNNVTVDFLVGELSNIPKEFKRHKKGKALSVAARQTIMNVYFSLSGSYPNETFCKIVKKTAEMTGVSEKTIWRVKKEHTELNGKFKEPANKRDLMLGKKIRLARYDETALTGIRNIVYEFVSRNEIPTCKKLMEIVNADKNLPDFGSVRTFHRLLKDMGYDAKYQLNPTEVVKHVPRKRDNGKNKKPQTTAIRNGKDIKGKSQIGDFNFEVREVKTSEYDECKIVYREECLTLYGIKMGLGRDVYELIIFAPMSMVEKPVKGFSLFRMEDKQEAVGQFLLLKKILPLYYNCTPQLLVCKNLKELCDVVRSNPSWTIAHIVASLGWQSCVRYDILESLLNEVCPNTLETPIIVAVKFKRLEVIRSLMNFNINIRSTDSKGNNVYHYAANTTREIINALQCYDTPSVINNKNIEGFTPLQIACVNSNTECIIELLESNADMNFSPIPNQYMLPPVYRSKNNQPRIGSCDQTKNMNGGTPLHCTESLKCLEALINFGCNIESKNFIGDTALHINVAKNILDCVLFLLGHGANPNCVSGDGNTPLHIAVKVGNPFLVKALSIFGANCNILNMDGDTPRHLAASRNFPNGDLLLFVLHSMGAGRCSSSMPNGSCTVGCSPMGEWNGLPPQKLLHLCETQLSNNLMQLPMKGLLLSPLNHLPNQKLCRVLCIDSGGNRAVIALQTIAQLESALGSCIIRHFNFIVATGSGALIALALAIGKSVQQCQGLLLKLRNKLYSTERSEPEELERYLRKEFGEILLSDIKNVKLMLIGVLEDRHPAEVYIFRNYASPTTILCQSRTVDPTFNFPIWRVAKAACSRFLIKDNSSLLKDDCTLNLPCLDALTEIQERNIAFNTMNQEDHIEAIDIMISIGNGLYPMHFGDDKQIDVIDKMTVCENRLVERTQAICSLASIPFYRINPPMSDILSYECCNSELLVKSMWETSYFFNSKRVDFIELAKLFIK